MRRSDREITDFNEIAAIVGRCETIHLALNDEGAPYIVPLSFGYEANDGAVTFYFHCATEGKKLDLIARDPRACVECEHFISFADTGHGITCEYESFIGFGTVHECTGKEKVKGLSLLIDHCGIPGYSAAECAALPSVRVFGIRCDRFTGKRRTL